MHDARPIRPLLAIMPAILLGLALVGCSTNAERIDRMALSVGLQKRVVPGLLHSHVIYEKRATALPPDRLLVFLEGDGSPWGSTGMYPATDPTSRNPLALRLMLQTNAAAIYVARPCYQSLIDAHCSAERWTGGRYSEEVVASMTTAITNVSRTLGASELVLIGYSGGGALAVLIAERLQNVAAVITLAANLDVAAWANHHRYLPLAQSLNPAQSENEHRWPEFHFSGRKDVVVPAATTDAYFSRYPAARHVVIETADHVCCWEAQWPDLLARAQKALE